MEREVATLENGARCCSWNYCGQRMAVGFNDGTISIQDLVDPSSISSFSPSFKWKAHSDSVTNVVWAPPEFGDAIACICVDGTLSLWEEVEEDTQPLMWRQCKVFESASSGVIDLQFGVFARSLKLVAAYSDGYVKVYELLDPLDLNKWQLQAEFQNVIDSVSRFGKPTCVSACIAWNPGRGESQQSSFILGYNSDLSQFNSAKIWEFEESHQRWVPVAELSLPDDSGDLIWEFEESHQRWVPVAELSLPDDSGDLVYSVAWAPNIGRPYEVIAVATCKGIAIWHIGLTPDSDGRLPTNKVALLSGHDGEVWQLEWDMSGMTLASTGGDGTVKLWQSDLNGIWHEQAALECNGGAH